MLVIPEAVHEQLRVRDQRGRERNEHAGQLLPRRRAGLEQVEVEREYGDVSYTHFNFIFGN